MSQPSTQIVIEHTPPNVQEYLKLRREGGLSMFSPEAAQIGLAGSFFGVTLRHDGDAIGMGRLVGDGGCFMQIVDIAVDPQHRGKGFGKVIMQELMTFAKANLPNTTFISLLADVPADQLYAQYGFQETAPESLGMSCINRCE